ncbi:transferase activity protein [[Candida] boidinii]|nr:transferase activity protein [[Candida] boidinii]OWB62920.1 transferase activity protein [[Candida] boidinii]OWB73916.1 transferase activity protein [[Candida] boidinii]
MNFMGCKTQKDLISICKKIIPPLSPNLYKGQAGRIAVIGGCEDYTGAPFFSAHSASMLGCDLTHVICESNAATVIKSYSPDLMVHPYLKDTNSYNQWKLKEILLNSSSSSSSSSPSSSPSSSDINDIEPFIKSQVLPKIQLLLERIHVVVIGPGFGRDPIMLKTLELIINELKKSDKPIILDADALYLLSIHPNIIKNYSNCIITPNIVEFKRICNSINIEFEINEFLNNLNNEKLIELLQLVSLKLGNITILLKGLNDYIVTNNSDNNKLLIINDNIGSFKRVGGQGDTLTGLISCLWAWGSYTYKNQLFPQSKLNPILNDEQIKMISCFGGSLLTRNSANLAFKDYGRSLQTSDIHKYINKSYNQFFN